MEHKKTTDNRRTYCIICGAEMLEGPLCAQCDGLYFKEAAQTLYKKGIEISTEEWMRNKIIQKLPTLKEELEQAEKELQICKAFKNAAVEAIIQDKINGRDLDPRLVQCLYEQIDKEDGQETWKNLGGPRGVWRVHAIKGRILEGERYLRKLEQQEKSEPNHGSSNGPGEVETTLTVLEQ